MKYNFAEKALISQKIKAAIGIGQTIDARLDEISVELEALDVLAVKIAHLIVDGIDCDETWMQMSEYCSFVAERNRAKLS